MVYLSGNRKSLGISDKTIRKMVEEISKQLPSTVTIEVSRGKGIVLQRDGRSTISEVISSMFRQTIFYRLMDFVYECGSTVSGRALRSHVYEYLVFKEIDCAIK